MWKLYIVASGKCCQNIQRQGKEKGHLTLGLLFLINIYVIRNLIPDRSQELMNK